MNKTMNYDVIIVGAGLAGCSAAIQLADRGWRVLLLEQQKYPSHKLCGEFLSVEVIANFDHLGILEAVRHAGAHPIDRALLTTAAGDTFSHCLPGIALGLSRYQLDDLLFKRSQTMGATCADGTIVREISGDLANGFTVTTNQDEFRSALVLGAYGKRSALDKKFNRQFVQKRSPWIAFKAHGDGLSLPGIIEVHGFAGGYCGLSTIETGQVNLCWIGHESILKNQSDRNLPSVLYTNPVLADRLAHLRLNPDVNHHLSQISFQIKGNFEGDICMIGDTVGMITPLCGDGMAMALRSADIVVPFVHNYLEGTLSSNHLKQQYSRKWQQEFWLRLQLGRSIHQGFIRPQLAHIGIALCRQMPPIGNWLIQQTRGRAEAVNFISEPS